eukprot:scpid101265/ scgid15218/ 
MFVVSYSIAKCSTNKLACGLFQTNLHFTSPNKIVWRCAMMTHTGTVRGSAQWSLSLNTIQQDRRSVLTSTIQASIHPSMHEFSMVEIIHSPILTMVCEMQWSCVPGWPLAACTGLTL